MVATIFFDKSTGSVKRKSARNKTCFILRLDFLSVLTIVGKIRAQNRKRKAQYYLNSEGDDNEVEALQEHLRRPGSVGVEGSKTIFWRHALLGLAAETPGTLLGLVKEYLQQKLVKAIN